MKWCKEKICVYWSLQGTPLKSIHSLQLINIIFCSKIKRKINNKPNTWRAMNRTIIKHYLRICYSFFFLLLFIFIIQSLIHKWISINTNAIVCCCGILFDKLFLGILPNSIYIFFISFNFYLIFCLFVFYFFWLFVNAFNSISDKTGFNVILHIFADIFKWKCLFDDPIKWKIFINPSLSTIDNFIFKILIFLTIFLFILFVSSNK